MGGNGKRLDLCSTSDVKAGEGLHVEIGARSLAVFLVDGEYFVTDDECTHGAASLCEGFLEGHVIECLLHNGAFDIRTGEPVAPPCDIPLATYPVIIEGDRILIEV